jgi:hypothetical protein
MVFPDKKGAPAEGGPASGPAPVRARHSLETRWPESHVMNLSKEPFSRSFPRCVPPRAAAHPCKRLKIPPRRPKQTYQALHGARPGTKETKIFPSPALKVVDRTPLFISAAATAK